MLDLRTYRTPGAVGQIKLLKVERQTDVLNPSEDYYVIYTYKVSVGAGLPN